MQKQSGYSKTFVILVSVFLLIVNGVLGTVLIVQSRNDLAEQMRERMLDILNSAAALLDGDVLENLQAEDRDTEEYQSSLAILRAFQENFNLDYIYGIRDMGNKEFTFTIDPDPDSPGDFGEPIAYTEALYSASLGVAAVDKEPYEDRWGRFYSAYVPVFDSQGRVGGIIAVDVEADWYEKQQREHIFTTLIICAASLLIGGIIAFLIMGKLRKRVDSLNSEMGQLAKEVEDLAIELRFASGRKGGIEHEQIVTENSVHTKNGFEELSTRLKNVRTELQQYIDEAHELAYTDPLTGSGNRNAYVEVLKKINKKIADGTANFAITVFDINGLKTANDSFGHEFGDMLIISVSDILKESINFENLFRIGGDEFVAVLEGASKNQLEEIFTNVDKLVAEKNQTVPDFKEKTELAISKGCASFVGGEDSDVRSVFRRADDAMYADKAAYYKTHDRRRR